jgi:hypothetical protein
MSLVIRGGHVLRRAAAPLETADVLIDRDRIVAIAPRVPGIATRGRWQIACHPMSLGTCRTLLALPFPVNRFAAPIPPA